VGNTMSESLYLIDNRRDKHGQSLSISSLTCLGDKKECLSRRGSATNSFFFWKDNPCSGYIDLSDVSLFEFLSILATLKSRDFGPSALVDLRSQVIFDYDRYTILSEKLLTLLREYYRQYRPGEWLFEGQSGGRYSATSIEKIFRKAVSKAGIRKYVTPHSLRHSFATHLLEQGISLRYIQEILGHSSSKTTEIYTHVATNEIGQIKNPLDN